MKANLFFKQEEVDQIIKCIESAEKQTSGEIRLHVERKCKGETIKRAVQVFKNLKMHKTELHNGTLIYLATDDHKFAIIGDKGIHEKVPVNFWEDVKDAMRENFKRDEFAKGICLGIEQIGKKLHEFFPYQAGDVNELSNEISVGE